MKKQRVAMPGMVRAQVAAATSPVATSSEHKAETVEAPEMERKISSGPLPLPGMESPKLPLPGQEGFSPPVQAENRAKNEAHEQETNGDPTMSTLLSSGYQTVHSLDTVQPSESNTLHSGGTSRPSTRTLSHEFEKRHHDSSAFMAPSPGSPVTSKSAAPLSSGSEDNPWAAIGSAMLEPAQNAPQDQSNHRSKPSWEGTLKTLGKGPARHAPRPPSRQNSQEVPRMASNPIAARKTGKWPYQQILGNSVPNIRSL